MNASPRQISVILWTVNLSSIAASVFSYVYLAYHVYRQTDSVMLSEAVLVAPMVVPVVLCLLINRMAGSRAPRPLLIWFNVAGVGVALLTFALTEHHVAAALLGTLVIGFIDAMQRVARTVAIKRYFSSADVRYALPITLTAQFIAGGVAGVGLSFYKTEITPTVACAFVAGAFALAALAARLLPRVSGTTAVTSAVAVGGALRVLKQLLERDEALRRSFFAFLIFVSIFQGFFNVSRVTLPTHVLGLPQSYVGYLQIIGATAALAAALLFFWLGKRKFIFGKTSIVAISALSLLTMVAAMGVPQVPTAFALYFVYMFSWEILFFKYQADVVNATPSDQMALVATFQYAGVYLGMLAFAFIGGLVTYYAGLTVAALVFALAYMVLMPMNSARRKPALPGARPA